MQWLSSGSVRVDRVVVCTVAYGLSVICGEVPFGLGAIVAVPDVVVLCLVAWTYIVLLDLLRVGHFVVRIVSYLLNFG